MFLLLHREHMQNVIHDPSHRILYTINAQNPFSYAYLILRKYKYPAIHAITVSIKDRVNDVRLLSITGTLPQLRASTYSTSLSHNRVASE